MRQAFLALCVTLLLAPAALADQVTLKNGDRLTGVIEKSDGTVLTIRTEFAGTVAVQWDAVEQISSEQPLFLTLKDDQVVVGSLDTVGGNVRVATAEAGTVQVSRESITLLRSREAQAAWELEMDRLRNPGLLDLWDGSVDVGLSLTRGNAETSTFSLGANAARSTPRDRIGVYAASLFATNSTTGSSVTTANAIRGGARYDLTVSDRVFAFGVGDLEFDEFQKLDLRLVLGGGMGWHAYRSETTVLDIFGGGTLNKETFSTGLKRTSGEILIGQELSHKISGRTSLREKLVFFPNLSETGEFRLTFDTSAVTTLSRWLAWHVTFSDRFLSNPVPGTQKNDILLTTGVRLTFGR